MAVDSDIPIRTLIYHMTKENIASLSDEEAISLNNSDPYLTYIEAAMVREYLQEWDEEDDFFSVPPQPSMPTEQKCETGVEFPVRSTSTPRDSTVRQGCVGLAQKGSRHPQVSPAALKSWWATWSNDPTSTYASEKQILEAVKQAFPDNSVSRDRVRELRGPQKRGPKPFSDKSTAK